MSGRWALWALRAGHSSVDQSMLTYLEGPGTAVEIPHVAFLVTGQANVLIDTSFRSAASVQASYPQDIARAAGGTAILGGVLDCPSRCSLGSW